MAKRKKKSTEAKTFLIVLLILAALASITWWLNGYFSKPSFVHYKEFGTYIPSNYAVHGIDVSRYQGNINWPDVKEMNIRGVNIDFAFIKATEGTDLVDERFGRNWVHAAKQKLPRGAYHFFNARRNAAEQADNFVQRVKLKPGDLPPVLDVEQDNGVSKELIQQRVAEWLLLVERNYGVKPIIYTNVDFYNRFLSPRFDHYPLWVAHYLVKDRPRIGRKWLFWQHSESAHVNGIDSFVDFNVFNGDSADFQQLLIR